MNIIEFDGKIPQIDKSVVLFPNVYVIGDVSIGEDSSVWFGSVLRGDLNRIVIGKRTNIQDLVIIHTSLPDNKQNLSVVVGDDVTIGHRVTLHACKISDRSLIGMGSVILDDVLVGEDSFITAFSFLPKGKKYPPRSLISGNPAKLVRPLRDEEITNIKKEAELYMKLKDKYKF